jgi:hypothetical protein
MKGLSMPAKFLTMQANQLRKVSERLESLAEKHSMLTAPLMAISGTIRACATFLDVLVATRLSTKPA